MVLDDIRLTVERGEYLFLVGPPGSGKTVLLKLLCGELRPRRGQILVNNRNVTRLSKGKVLQMRKGIGIIPQNPKPLLRRTVYENLILKLRSLGLPRSEAMRKALDALETIGLTSIRDLTPSELSAAEMKMAYIALAISNDPILLLCDTPCAGLDEEGALTVLNSLERVHQRKRMTLLVATQNAEMAERFGKRTVFLQDGRISESPQQSSKKERR